MDLKFAHSLAVELKNDLSPYCRKIEIAGSVRRQKPECKDIELICVPHMYTDLDMFQIPKGDMSIFETPGTWGELIASWNQKFKVDQVVKNGPKYKQIKFKFGAALDLFIVTPPAEWGVQFLIRTGPSAFSHQAVTKRRWMTKPIDGVRYPGLLPSNAEVKDGAVHVNGKILPMPDEKDFFDFIGLGFVSPEDRQPYRTIPQRQYV
jgi:DNA polymerase/3'-5' exonuclease PolX